MLLRKTKTCLIFALLSVLLVACGKEKKVEKYVAKVGDQYLTENELKSYLSSEEYKDQYKEEIIRNWIENEVLYQEAVNEGIPNENAYKNLVNRTNRELAVAMLKKNVLENFKQEVTVQDLVEYYEKFKNDFRLPDDAYMLNLISFNNEEKAIQFRSLLLESNWDRILTAYRKDPSAVEIETKKFLYSHDIYPASVLKSLDGMLPLEVSGVIQTEPNRFTIVQLIEKYGKNSVPGFENIKNVVRQRYLAFKKKEYLDKYISDLISNYNPEIEWNQE